ncbi:MAG: hypothetical protein IPJ71_06770 [Bdellovibrionales bacterium]|nr:hypothetical protein [Bdellovibrionales bacterium]
MVKGDGEVFLGRLHLFYLALISMAFVFGYYLGGCGNHGKKIGSHSSLEAENKLAETEASSVQKKLLALNRVTDQFAKFSESDISDYLKLKSEKDRYYKAEEILGKIMLLFLVDLGIKTSGEQMVFARTVSQGRKRKDMVAPVDLTESDEVAPNSLESTSIQSANQLKSSSEAKSILEAEKVLSELRSDNEIETFLKSVSLGNLFDSLKNANEMDMEQIRDLRGTFSGELVFDSPLQEKWEVKLIFSGRLESGTLVGKSRVELAKDGKIFSNSRSNGNLSNLKSLPNGQRGVLIEILGGEGFFQLYSVPQLQKLIGLYYRRENPGSYRKAGSLTLLRH